MGTGPITVVKLRPPGPVSRECCDILDIPIIRLRMCHDHVKGSAFLTLNFSKKNSLAIFAIFLP